MDDLYEKLQKIEALMRSTSSEGERRAAEEAKKRLQQRIDEKPKEYRFSGRSPWEKRLFVVVCNKHGLKTYRHHRQKYTTAMVRSTQSIMDQLIMPEYKRYSRILYDLVNEITNDLITKVSHGEEETVIAGEIGAPA